jgi:hypothetical protein
MVPNVTLLDLVNALTEHVRSDRSDREVTATIVCVVNQGHVRLCGTFNGARFDMATHRAA